MSGKFTGAGVGPGDPELITCKALRVIRESSVIAIPVSDPELQEPVRDSCPEKGRYSRYLEGCVAYQTARRACPETERKEVLFLPMPMIKDRERLKAVHDLDVRY